jgi:LEA14-like dessication related protein
VTATPARRTERRARRRVAATLLAVAAAFAAGCEALPPLGLVAPKVSLAGLSIRDVTRDDVGVVVLLEVENPNGRDVPLGNLRFDVDLFGQRFASGAALDALVTLPASASTRVPVEVRVPWNRLPVLARELRRSGGRADYALRGSATWGADGLRVPFERNGSVDLPARLMERSPRG